MKKEYENTTLNRMLKKIENRKNSPQKKISFYFSSILVFCLSLHLSFSFFFNYFLSLTACKSWRTHRLDVTGA